MMSNYPIHDIKSLNKAKRDLKGKLDKEEILIRTHIEYFHSRWNDEKIGGGLKYKGVIMDGVSLALDAVYVLKAGVKNKTQLFIRLGEVAIGYISEKYASGLFSFLRNWMPKRKSNYSEEDDEMWED